MNYIIVNKFSDLQDVIEGSIYISEHGLLTEEETYNNMWAIGFSDQLIKKIEVNKLEKFFS